MNHPDLLPACDHYKQLASQYMKCELEEGLYRVDINEFLGAGFQPERVWFLQCATKKELMMLWCRAYQHVTAFYQERRKQAIAMGDDKTEEDCDLTLGNAANYFRDFQPTIQSFCKEKIDPLYVEVPYLNEHFRIDKNTI